MSKKKYSESELLTAIKNCKNYRQVLQFLGLSNGAKNYTRLRQQITDLNIDISHFNPRFGRKLSNKEITQEIFILNSTISSGTLRKYYLAISEYICAKCKNAGYYNNENLTLQIDHINGIRTDNRIENLRWLCPNCHSQTATFGSRNLLNNNRIRSKWKRNDKHI